MFSVVHGLLLTTLTDNWYGWYGRLCGFARHGFGLLGSDLADITCDQLIQNLG